MRAIFVIIPYLYVSEAYLNVSEAYLDVTEAYIYVSEAYLYVSEAYLYVSEAQRLLLYWSNTASYRQSAISKPCWSLLALNPTVRTHILQEPKMVAR